MLSATQDIVSDITPSQNALTKAIDAITSLPLIGSQLKDLQQLNAILQGSLTGVENQTRNLADGHFQLAIPLGKISHTFTFNLGLDAFLQVSTSGGVTGSITSTLDARIDLADTNLDIGFGLTLSPNFQATIMDDVDTEVQEVTEPIRPIVNVLDTPLPVLSAFDSSEI